MIKVRIEEEKDENGTITGLSAFNKETDKEELFCPWDVDEEHTQENMDELVKFFKKYLSQFGFEVE